MGIYRLFLAVAVLASHVGVTFHGRNEGVFSVVSFFLLSGYVMTALVEKHYRSPSRLGRFYLDRAMRLFPQFLFYFLLTLILISFKRPVSPFISGLTGPKALLDATLLPLNFFRYFPDSQVIPQAWSLGLEAQFYLAIPLIIYGGMRTPIFVASMALFLVPYLGIWDADTWGYRMLPATLFMFLFGSFLYRRASGVLLPAGYLALWALFGRIVAHESSQHYPMIEILTGLMWGIPAVWVLTKLRPGRLDEIAGNLSYGVFLNHFFVIWLLEDLGVQAREPWYLCSLIGISFGLSALSYAVIERPIVHRRRSLRISAKSGMGPQAVFGQP